jgi:hypothetical protein
METVAVFLVRLRIFYQILENNQQQFLSGKSIFLLVLIRLKISN